MSLEFQVTAGYCRPHGPARSGLRKYGVAPGGPFDSESAELANALVGNDLTEPIVELASTTVAIRFSEPGQVAIVGAGHEFKLGTNPVPLGSSLRVSEGDCLSVSPTLSGFRAYASFRPGGRTRPRRLSETPSSTRSGPIRVISPNSLALGPGKVSAHIDRTGIRIDMPNPGRPTQSELSRPVVVGAVQTTPDGLLLIHGPDGPTIGGYDLVGVVARVDCDRLSQLRPGEAVEFLNVSLEQAKELWEVEDQRRRTLLAQVAAAAL